jgi:hypothetical protein
MIFCVAVAFGGAFTLAWKLREMVIGLWCPFLVGGPDPVICSGNLVRKTRLVDVNAVLNSIPLY